MASRNFDRLVEWHRARPRLALDIHLGVCILLLGIALVAQYGFGLQPCILCLWQRAPYAVIAFTALLSLFFPRTWTPVFLSAFAVLYAIEALLAFYHVGVEAHWWASAAGCGFHAQTGAGIKALYDQIASAPITPCDKPAFRFLGLTMAGWNVPVALGLAVFTAFQAKVQAPWWKATQSQ